MSGGQPGQAPPRVAARPPPHQQHQQHQQQQQQQQPAADEEDAYDSPVRKSDPSRPPPAAPLSASLAGPEAEELRDFLRLERELGAAGDAATHAGSYARADHENSLTYSASPMSPSLRPSSTPARADQARRPDLDGSGARAAPGTFAVTAASFDDTEQWGSHTQTSEYFDDFESDEVAAAAAGGDGHTHAHPAQPRQPQPHEWDDEEEWHQPYQQQQKQTQQQQSQPHQQWEQHYAQAPPPQPLQHHQQQQQQQQQQHRATASGEGEMVVESSFRAPGRVVAPSTHDRDAVGSKLQLLRKKRVSSAGAARADAAAIAAPAPTTRGRPNTAATGSSASISPSGQRPPSILRTYFEAPESKRSSSSVTPGRGQRPGASAGAPAASAAPPAASTPSAAADQRLSPDVSKKVKALEAELARFQTETRRLEQLRVEQERELDMLRTDNANRNKRMEEKEKEFERSVRGARHPRAWFWWPTARHRYRTEEMKKLKRERLELEKAVREVQRAPPRKERESMDQLKQARLSRAPV
jgi:hypothetical protein